MTFGESALAHSLLDGLSGIEIGGSAHNPFGLKTLNVDCHASMETVYKQAEIHLCGRALPVDVASWGDALPFQDSSFDFVISSHVAEHFPDPIKALKEWRRVVRSGGYIYVIVPHKTRTFDVERSCTTLEELIVRHETGVVPDFEGHLHCSVWVTQDFVELLNYMGFEVVEVQDVDDKVGNGFTVAARVQK